MTRILGRPTGMHRAADALADRDEQIDRLTADNCTVTAANETLVCELTRAMLRACQDGMQIAALKDELKAALAEISKLRNRVYRDAANLERLRHAVINARPRIDVTVQRLDRPYVSHVQLPYPVPVGSSTANDETQQLPILDLPTTWPTYAARTVGAA